MKNRLRRSLHLIEQRFDKLRMLVLGRKRFEKKVQLVGYNGFGNKELVHFGGRVLKDRKIPKPHVNDKVLKNVRRMYKRFGSIELPDVQVTATYGAETQHCITDEEGYYQFEMPFKTGAGQHELWHQVRLELSPSQKFEATQTAWVQIPLPETTVGIISDIDDTILHTGATNLIQALTTTFTKNAQTRLSFRGVDELYAGLQKRDNAHAVNPIFYLSNSPWNLYDFLTEFMEVKNIPKGSLLLRDWGLDDKKMFVDDDHKLNSITKLLNTYAKLPFILIGDSGEKDPEYYQKIVHQFPNRIQAIYIRDVSNEQRDSEVKNIATEMESLGVPMFLMKDSLVAAEHAERMGWISIEALERVREAVRP